jgi:hypothetical protein
MPVEVLTVEANYVGASLDKGLQNTTKELAATAVATAKLDSALDNIGFAKLQADLTKTSTNLKAFRDALSKSTNPQEIQFLSRSVALLEKQYAALQTTAQKTQGFKQVKVGADAAGQSLTNLGRIAQDAPFGFIGIQNNINPLLESFQRLKVETGSTGGALKSLAGSLLGAGGIGLAVSVATGLLTVLTQNGFFKAKKGADELTEANKKTKDSLDKYNDSVKSNLLDFEKQRTTLQLLVATAISDVSTKQQQESALRRLNELIPDNIGVLTKQNITTQEGTRILREYTKAIEAKGFAELLSGRIAQLSVDKLEKSIDTQKQIALLKEREAKANIKLTKITQGLQISNNEFAKEKALRREIADLQGQQIALSIQQNNAVIDINKQIEIFRSEALKAFQASSILDVDKTKADATKTVKSVETITSTIQNLQKEIQFLNATQLTFGTDESAAKIKAIESTIKTLIKDFKVDPQDSIIQKLLTGGKLVNIVQGLNIPGIKGLTKDVGELIETEAATAPTPTVTVPVNVQAAIDKIDVGKIVGPDSEFTAQVEEITDRLRQTVANSFASIFEGIGAGVSAQGIFANFFKTIFTELGAGVQQLGIQSAAVQKLLAALRASFSKPPGIAAAIGLIALGGIIKGLASRIQIPAFATGGIAPGGSILVGERGPEIITAPRGATITPNAQTNAMLSGAGGGTVVFRIQGRELVGVLNNTNATLGRNGQG